MERTSQGAPPKEVRPGGAFRTTGTRAARIQGRGRMSRELMMGTILTTTTKEGLSTGYYLGLNPVPA